MGKHIENASDSSMLEFVRCTNYNDNNNNNVVVSSFSDQHLTDGRLLRLSRL